MLESLPQIEILFPAGLIAVIVVPGVFWAARHGRLRIEVQQQRQLTMARVTLLLLLIFAISVAVFHFPTKQKWVVFAVDTSRSVGKSTHLAEEFIAAATNNKSNQRYSILQFSAGTFASDNDELLNNEMVSNPAATVSLAAASVPENYSPEIVQITDGLQTHGDVLRAALGVSVPISAIPIAWHSEPEVCLSAVETPSQAFPFEQITVGITVSSNHDDRAVVDLYRNSERVARRDVTLRSGENRIRFQATNGMTPSTVFRAVVSLASDTEDKNNQRSSVVVAPQQSRVLLSSSLSTSASLVAGALRQGGFDVSIVQPQQLPKQSAELDSYDLVVLPDVAANRIDDETLEALDAYVQAGGGLISIGGKEVFAVDVFRNSTLERMMPVDALTKREEQRDVLAMVLVIDKSESMLDENRMTLAKEAAKQAVDLLNEQDKIGLITFGTDTAWVSEIAPCSNKKALKSRIDSINPTGATRMYPALLRAFLALEQTDADRRHLVLLTDGVSAPGDFVELAEQMAQAKITVSTISIGDGADQTILQDISETAKGRHYHCADPASIPKVLVSETLVVTSSAPETQFKPMANKLLPGLDVANVPPLFEVAPTAAKPNAQVLLMAPADTPLLSWRRYGTGITLAFTADVTPEPDRLWPFQPNYAAFWSRLARHAMRKPWPYPVHVEIKRYGGQATATVNAIDANGRFMNEVEFDSVLTHPNGTTNSVTTTQIGPGRYELSFPTEQLGQYRLQLSWVDENGRHKSVSREFVLDYPDELRLSDPNRKLLRQVAEATGGKFNPQPAEVFNADGLAHDRVILLWQYLLILAEIVYVFEILRRKSARRVHFKADGDRAEFAITRSPTVASGLPSAGNANRRTITNCLTPVRRSIRRRRMMQVAINAIAVGSALAIACCLLRSAMIDSPMRVVSMVVIAASPVIGMLWMLRRYDDWKQAARAVDRHFGWKDSVLTALEFSSDPAPSPMKKLQIRDAVSRLETADVRDVLPRYQPTGVGKTAALLLVAAALVAYPGVSDMNWPYPASAERAAIAAEVTPEIVNRSITGYRLEEPMMETEQTGAAYSTDPRIVRRYFEGTP